MEQIIRKQIRVYGSVQGVGFRYRAIHAAQLVGVTGLVHNEWDGSVYLEVQGTEAQIDELFQRITGAGAIGFGTGGNWISIDRMESKTVPVIEEERSFECYD